MLSRVGLSSTCPWPSKVTRSHRLPNPRARSQNSLLRSIGVVLSASPCVMRVGTILFDKVCAGDNEAGAACPFIRSRNRPSETASTTGETTSNASGPPLPELPSAEPHPTVAADATSCPLEEIPHSAIRDGARPSFFALLLRNDRALQTSENDSTGEFVLSTSLYSSTTETKPLSANRRAGLKSCSGLPRDHAPPCTKRIAGRALPEAPEGANSKMRRSRPATLRYTEEICAAVLSRGSSAVCAKLNAAKEPKNTAQSLRSARDVPGQLTLIESLL